MSESTTGKRLKELRMQWGFTQSQVADYLGFTQTQLSKLENDKIPLKMSELLKLCDLYCCNQLYIVYGEGTYEKPNFFIKSDKTLDLATIASMNRIILNMADMKKIEKTDKYQSAK